MIDQGALEEAARQLRESARVHKRSERAHRSQARELMRALDELQRGCAEHGIALCLDTQAQPEEA